MRDGPFDEDELRHVVGSGALERGRAYFRQHRVGSLVWSGDGRNLRARVMGSGGARYSTSLVFTSATVSSSTGLGATFDGGVCTCPVGIDCKHVAATWFAAQDESAPASLPGAADPSFDVAFDPVFEPTVDSPPHVLVPAVLAPPPPPPPWERTLLGLLADAPAAVPPRPYRPLALQFELLDTSRLSTRSGYGRRPRPKKPTRLGMRPVTVGEKGAWVRTRVSWQTVSHGGDESYSPEQSAWFDEFSALAVLGEPAYYGYSTETWVYLDDFDSASLWTMFDRAADLGIPLVHTDPSLPPVRIRNEAADVHLDVRTAGTGLQIEPTIRLGDEVVDRSRVGFIGSPAHGLYLRDSADDTSSLKRVGVQLLRLATPLGEATQKLLRTPKPVSVPARQIDDFTLRVLPRLRATLPVRSDDASFDIPAAPEPFLVLTVTHQQERGIHLGWEWQYAVPGDPGDAKPGRRAPLWAGGTDFVRDSRAERAIVEAAAVPLDRYPELAEAVTGRLAPESELRGMPMVEFLQHEVPRLRELAHTRVMIEGDVVDYREAEEPALISLSTTAREGDRDWFDLSVEVTVDAVEVPFDQLFVALALDDDHLILPSGLYFRLDDPRFDQLRALITEARSLIERPGEGLALSRYQTGLWDELQQIGVVTAQAAAWESTLKALAATDEIATTPLPAGFAAELRSYQQHGYDWLTFLYEHGLGGVLADDMGLGKTVQMLATIARQRQNDPQAPPFLVVAPTSVVGNWASEARRFAPGLRVAAIESTGRRRTSTLADTVEGADIVVTSYALFRIEFEQYSGLAWSALILDEAQFVKNHQSSTYQCVRRLDAPVKFAITGTPIENNLMELWSMFSIVAPGLFAGPKQFVDYYGGPIEKATDESPALLAQLRRRIRPLMLRRTKEQVATDLPEKQEQVIEVALNPAHRRVYDTYLQRERQKVLGLIDDMNANRFQIFRSLTLLRRAALDVSLVDEAHDGVASTKIEVLFELLGDIIAEGHRVLIFSQFTSFLGRVRSRLEAESIDFAYLDGATRGRARVIDGFRSGTAPVFLISLKSGGVGLNLTEADYCILLDPWWNPATEAQAVDRVHRIGQTKNVMVYRLVATGTIEEKVMTLKESKAKLFASVMAEEDGEAVAGGAGGSSGAGGAGGAGGARITGSDIRELLG